jgi:hypothetical protein
MAYALFLMRMGVLLSKEAGGWKKEVNETA